MNRKQLTFLGVLLAATSLVGCGDNNDKRLSDADVACIKLLQLGRSCAGVNGAAATATSTVTSTVTVTNTTVINP